MTENHVYQGHDIALNLRELRPEHYRWAWRIEGRYVAHGTTPVSIERAREEALYFARQQIAQLKSIPGSAELLIERRLERVLARFGRAPY